MDAGNATSLVLQPPLHRQEGYFQGSGVILLADGPSMWMQLGNKRFMLLLPDNVQYLNGARERARIGGFINFVGRYLGQANGSASFIATHIESN